MVIGIIFGSVVLFYILAVLVIGRLLLYNDVAARQKPTHHGLEDYDVEDVGFRSADGLMLRSWFVKSSGNPTNRCIVLLHGWRRDRRRVVHHIKLFVDSGFHVLAYDQRGHGASDTGLISYGVGEAHDLMAAVEYLKGRSDVAASHLAAVGHSLGSGGIVYAYAGSNRPAFRAVVLEGVFSESYDVGRYMLTNRFGPLIGYLIGVSVFTVGAKLWTMGRFRHSRPIDFADRISPTPLMIIRGVNDQMVPEASARDFIEKAKMPKVVWIHPQGRHTDAYKVYPEEYKSRVLGFLNEYLAPSEVPTELSGSVVRSKLVS